MNLSVASKFFGDVSILTVASSNIPGFHILGTINDCLHLGLHLRRQMLLNKESYKVKGTEISDFKNTFLQSCRNWVPQKDASLKITKEICRQQNSVFLQYATVCWNKKSVQEKNDLKWIKI